MAGQRNQKNVGNDNDTDKEERRQASIIGELNTRQKLVPPKTNLYHFKTRTVDKLLSDTHKT